MKKTNYKLILAKKVIDNLDDSEKEQLIKYYINYQSKLIDEKNEKIKEYSDFFKLLNKFLPKNNKIKG